MYVMNLAFITPKKNIYILVTYKITYILFENTFFSVILQRMLDMVVSAALIFYVSSELWKVIVLF